MEKDKLPNLKGRVAVITDGFSSLGIELAETFANAGANVAIFHTKRQELEGISRDIRAIGVRCIPFTCDVTDSNSIELAVSEVKKQYGNMDILVNNAAPTREKVTLGNRDGDSEADDKDLTGVEKLSKEFGELMVGINHGRIINIASDYALLEGLGGGDYHEANRNMVNLTRRISNQFDSENITANCLCETFEAEPSADSEKTEKFSNYMEKVKPIDMKEKIACAAVFLGANDAYVFDECAVTVKDKYTCI